MNKPKRYGIYTAQFPFLETNEGKIRPIIVVSEPYGDHSIIAIVPVSSKPKCEAADIILKDWHAEGLLKLSVARVHRLTTMLQSDLLTELGELTASDIESLRKNLKDFLDL